MSSYVPADIRRLVRERAGLICEYCLIHEEDTFLGCQIDHILPEKHGGKTNLENLALACAYCNRAKGADIGSIAKGTGKFAPFFNPRVDHWFDHFRMDSIRIQTLTDIGETTARILGFNVPERLWEREALAQCGRYPPLCASKHLEP